MTVAIDDDVHLHNRTHMSDNDDDDDDASGGGSTAEDNSTSDGTGASTTGPSTTNAVTALIQKENKWLVKARLSMVFMIVVLTSITAAGVNQFMKYVEFEDFTTRVSLSFFKVSLFASVKV